MPSAIFIAVFIFALPGAASAGDKDAPSKINISSLDTLVSSSKSGSSIAGPALNEALGLKPDSTPSDAMQSLNQAVQQAEKDAVKANDYATTTANAFSSSSSTSTVTAGNLSAAIWAAGVQKALIDFASALADLASVSDFFEGLAKGDFKDSNLLEKFDSIYEMAKDAESGLNNVTANMTELTNQQKLTRLKDAPGVNVANNPADLIETADDYWKTDGLTNINSLKSDLSDLTNLYKDYKGGKPINPRTLGQLVIRIGKGFAENDLKKRLKRIKNLQRDLAAEQLTTSGLAGQLQVANDAKWKAMDALKTLRAAQAALTESNPETLGDDKNLVSAAGKPQRVPVTVKCKECQPLADQINQAQRALDVLDSRKKAIEKKKQELEKKKRQLKRLREELSSFDRRSADLRKDLRESDVLDDVRGATRETQNDLNLRSMDRAKAVNEITRLETEIEIREGEGMDAELERISKAQVKLRASLDKLRKKLAECDKEPCKKSTSTKDTSLATFGALLTGDPSLSRGGLTTGAGKPSTGVVTRARSIAKAGTSCPKCQIFVDALNRYFKQLDEKQRQLDDFKNKKSQAQKNIRYYELIVLGLNSPEVANRNKLTMINWKWVDKASVGERQQVIESYQSKLSDLRDDLLRFERVIKRLQQEISGINQKIANTYAALLNCEQKCTLVEILDVKNLLGNNPYNQRDPVSEEGSGANETTIQVIFCGLCGPGVFVPVKGLNVANPDACPSKHYHGGPARACDGNLYGDPDAGGCGYGEVPNTTSIPVSQCNN